MTTEDFFNLIRDAIAPDFRKVAESGYIEHQEIHHDGPTSGFRLNPSAPHVAFSMDVRGKEPVAILNKGKFRCRNDLIVICLDESGSPLVFLFEHKNSEDIGDAQFQLDSGQAFCEYLFHLLKLQDQRLPDPRYFGIAVYRPKSISIGTTKPKEVSFKPTGKHQLLRAGWHMDVTLPLTALISAAEKA